MDGLSTAASVIAVIQITGSIASVLKGYYEFARDARGNIQKLYHSVNSLETVLTALNDLKVRKSDSGLLLTTALLENPHGPLQEACRELESLRKKLGNPSRFDKRIARIRQSAIWPLQEKDVEKIVKVLDSHKSSLELEVGVENLLVSHSSSNMYRVVIRR
jgi:hypothetical protein